MKSKPTITRWIYLVGLVALTFGLTEWLSITKTKAAVITVINTDNAGAGSLRQAILDANATILTTDTILFAISGGGVKTINVTSALPTITAPLIIDGWSQGGAGYTGPPLIELNGSGAGAGASGLVITAGDSTVKGLAVNRFSGNGVVLQTNGSNIIRGCYIGTNASGLIDFGNGGNGLLINGSPGNQIGAVTPTPGTAGGNIISGNSDDGVEINGGGNSNVLAGNIIGLNAAGSAALANEQNGVHLSAANNTIGGATSQRNIISGNLNAGVFVEGASATNIAGNFIGTNLAGTAALGNANGGVRVTSAVNVGIGGPLATARNVISGNGQYGIFMSGSPDCFVEGNIIGLDANGANDITGGEAGVVLLFGSDQTRIGGSTATPGTPPGNIISGMGTFGIHLSEVNLTTVAGNIIGLDATGAVDRGNGADGVLVIGAGNIIGGPTPNGRNVISGNGANGIHITNDASSQNLVRNNLIGTQLNPSLAAGNDSNGVFVANGSNNTIGGGVGLGNTIAFNNLDGVNIATPSISNGLGNPIFVNSIHSNGQLGIDLNPDGVTVNDPLDADTGGVANDLQNFPELTSVKSGNGTFVLGSLNSSPSATFTIEFFSNPSCDASGHGEGQTFQGSIVVTTGADGNITFAHTLPNAVPVGHLMTCTATNNATRGTSEFSSCQLVTAQSPSLVEFAAATAAAFEDGVLIEWQTGMEVDNLGFNLYRNEAGKQSRVNQQLIAGSALTVGKGVTLLSGFSYQWWDSQPVSSPTQYWVESVDLDGSSAWHGPFAVSDSQVKERPARIAHARTLGSVGLTDAPSVQLEPLARPAGAKQSNQFSSTGDVMLAPSSGVKIAVKRAGFYRLTQPELVAAGLDSAVDPRSLQLFVDGREQAFYVTGESDGRLDSTDTVEFYGVGIDSPFTDSHNYFLIAGKQKGQRIALVPSLAEPGGEGSFAFTTERRDRTVYFSAVLNGELENFFGAVLATQPLIQSLTVRGADTSSQDASLEVALQGVTQVPHSVAVQLNGSTVGYIAFNAQRHSVSTFALPASLLLQGENAVTLIATGGSSDVSLVDYLRLTYQHQFKAENDSLRLTVEGHQRVTIRGFAQKRIRVFDVTNPDAVQELEGFIDQDEQGYNVSLEALGSGRRTLLALTDAAAISPDRVINDCPSSLRSRENASEFVIIAHRGLMQQAQLLKTHRQAQGFSVSVVDIEDVYDEFSFGQKTPHAVRDFLAYAAKHWQVPARYALLFGDASYDMKNYFGVGDFDVVPTKLIDTQFMEAASDDWLADFNGDGLADLSVGRLPVRNETEADAMIAKLIGYDKSKPSVEVLGVADRNEGYDFERAIDLLHALIPPDLKPIEVKRGQLGDTTAKATLLEALNRGQKLVSYSGHGSVNVWRGNLLTDADAGLLQNNERLSVFLMMNCLNGYFAEPRIDSLAESLLKAQGGAVAVWASSAMTYPDGQSQMNQMLYQQLFRNHLITLGEAVRVAKAATADTDVRLTWILLGDPTIKLK